MLWNSVPRTKTQGDAQQAQRAAEECALAYRRVTGSSNLGDMYWKRRAPAEVGSLSRYLQSFYLPWDQQSAPENWPKPKRKRSYSNHPFSGAKMLVSGSVYQFLLNNWVVKLQTFFMIFISIWGFPKWWYPTTIGFPTKNDHFGVEIGGTTV